MFKAIQRLFIMNMLVETFVFCQSVDKTYYRWAEAAIKQCHDYMAQGHSLEETAMYARHILQGMKSAYGNSIPCHAKHARGFCWGAREVIGIIERELFPNSLHF